MKKFLSVLLAILLVVGMAFTLVSCGEEPNKGNDNKNENENNNPSEPGNELAGTYDVTVWVSELDGVKELTLEQIKKFETNNPGIVINAAVEGVGEGEAATQMVTSVEDGADIFCFAQDQLSRLVMAGALSKLGQATSAEVTEINDAGSVAAASVGGALYCFPLTSDNGYFMFYDKSVIPEDHIDSLEAIIADCEAANRMFSFELEGSAWYTASFFFATGCVSEWTTELDGSFSGINDTFNSANGIIALRGMQKLLKSPSFHNSSAHDDFSAAIPSAVVVSGTWGTTTAQEALGENFAAADLPSFEVDGVSYHLGSYSGNKLLGVKPQTDVKKAAVLQKLALWLAGEECQNERFEKFGWGPSNKNSQSMDAVKSDIALSALAAQSEYAIPQGQIHGSWWDIAKVIASAAKTAQTEADLQAALDAYNTSISGLFTMSDEVKNAFTVIGSINGSMWDADFAMEKQDDGSWLTPEAYDLNEGEEFKIRQGLSWDVNYGGDGALDGANFVVETSGKYQIKFALDGEIGTIELVPAE